MLRPFFDDIRARLPEWCVNSHCQEIPLIRPTMVRTRHCRGPLSVEISSLTYELVSSAHDQHYPRCQDASLGVGPLQEDVFSARQAINA